MLTFLEHIEIQQFYYINYVRTNYLEPSAYTEDFFEQINKMFTQIVTRQFKVQIQRTVQ